MQSPQRLDPLFDAPEEGIEDNVFDLFTRFSPTSWSDGQGDKLSAAFAAHFLRSQRITSDVGLRSLSAKFTDSQIPEGSADVEGYFDYLIREVASHSIHTGSPRFIGHMTSALPYFVHQIGKVVTVMNQNLVKTETAKALTPYERQVIAILHRLVFEQTDGFYNEHIQRGDSTLGMVVSGGTISNITALWCARNASLGPKDDFAGIEAEGLPAALDFYGDKSAVVIGSSLMHYSFDKAAGVLGLGVRNLLKVPTDHAQRIDLSALRQTIADCRRRKQRIIALIGIAGTTDCGAIDPLDELAEIAHAETIHFHVDAAWGGPLRFSQRHRRKLQGLERADSVTIDGHKQLYVPMGIGLLLLRDPRLAQGIEKQARYIVRAGSFDLGKRSLEGSRPGMAVYLHAALQIIGRKGYESLIDEGVRKTSYMARVIATHPEFELLSEPEMNILTYRHLPEGLRAAVSQGRLTTSDNEAINRHNVRLQKAQRQAGQFFVSRTTLNLWRGGKPTPTVALRAVIANPLTAEKDIDAVLSDQVRIAAGLQP